jgi:hypothetical protein
LPAGARRRTGAGDPVQHHRELYDALLAHHGLRIGLRHARKHLGWALDAAAQTSAAPVELLQVERGRVLTPTIPRRCMAISPMLRRLRGLAEGAA